MVFFVDVEGRRVSVDSLRQFTYIQMERSRNGGEALYIEEDPLRILLFAPNYAVPTLGIYREEDYRLAETGAWYISLGKISWHTWRGEVTFWLDWCSRYVEFKYKFSIAIEGDISINQSLNCFKDLASLMSMPVSVLF
jgi:hypothetical protein